MKNRTLLEGLGDAVNKTVEEVSDAGGYIAIHFTDATTLLLLAEGDCECSDCDAYCYAIGRLPKSADMLYALEFITREEYDAQKAAAEVERLRAIEADERARYEKLKAKFEPARSLDAVDPVGGRVTE